MTPEAGLFWIAFLAGWLLFVVCVTAVIGATARTRDYADRVMAKVFGEGGPEW